MRRRSALRRRLGVTSIKGDFYVRQTSTTIGFLYYRRALQFHKGFAARALLQPLDFLDGAMPLTYAMLRFLRSCRIGHHDGQVALPPTSCQFLRGLFQSIRV
jgi:hypothetical protein